MKKRTFLKQITLYALLGLFCLAWAQPEAYALSARHHVYNMGRSLTKAVVAPVRAAFITGPKEIRETWRYEVRNREQPEDRGKFRYKLFAIWRAPADEVKAILDGGVESVQETANFGKEFLSIFFSD